MRLVEICESLKRVIANNVRVENEERGVVLAEGLLSQLERTRSP